MKFAAWFPQRRWGLRRVVLLWSVGGEESEPHIASRYEDITGLVRITPQIFLFCVLTLWPALRLRPWPVLICPTALPRCFRHWRGSRVRLHRCKRSRKADPPCSFIPSLRFSLSHSIIPTITVHHRNFHEETPNTSLLYSLVTVKA